MRSSGKIFSACLTLTIVSPVAYAQTQNDWSLPAREKTVLGSPYRVGAVTVCPPKGFTLGKMGDSSELSYVWLAKPYVKGQPATGFILTTMNLDAANQKEFSKLSAKDVARLYTKNFFGSWHAVKQTPWAEGTINGMRFVRSAWRATSNAGVKAHGFFYVANFKGAPYIFSGVEVDKGKSTEVLRVSDQAARTCAAVK